METSFKRAEMSDIEILMEFIREFCEVDQHPFDDSSIRVALEKIVRDDSLGRVWLVQHNSQAIGYIVLTFGYSLEYRGREAVIDEIYIRESYQGQGIGKRAIEFVEEVSPSLEIKVLHLEVERENTAAQNFYRKVGFEAQDSYLMTKWIAT
ncbi:GNAT family N-acetyltransferase [Microcoleus sp. FACHB-SPT15]|uniref:GNAT family N-acetyltransferase n=1 Tax=Microcoleus sp. FACHB-SPT15 TaxID=2692830 RepID=UPI001780A1D9|nr:GNAT family N-acetyltransferase [Microcoleus sp. FACHB-SPT15]MBD1808937.1 GNAT family N-acetyltransferase [Microcoleus sp. FACHB-SPT15]